MQLRRYIYVVDTDHENSHRIYSRYMSIEQFTLYVCEMIFWSIGQILIALSSMNILTVFLNKYCINAV